MAYDSVRRKMVLYGGFSISGAGYLGDTWEWDGSTWKEIAVAGPGLRSDFAMAFDSARGRTVLVGGYGPREGGSNYLNDTWEWDGTAWTQVDTPGPDRKWGSAMAYDSVRGKCVLVGGTCESAPCDGTWEFDGSTWSHNAASGPTPGIWPVMAFDSSRARTVLFGGSYDQTWEWDGDSWHQQIVYGPSALNGASMVYESARGHCVLFGGYDGQTRGDTWIFGPMPVRIVYVNQNVTTAGDGRSWATAFATASAGLSAAGAGDEVWVAKGSYKGTLTVGAGVALYGGFAGTETTRDQRDWITNVTILDGGGMNTIPEVLSCQSGVTVDGFTVRNAQVGITAFGGNATVSHNTVTNYLSTGIMVGSGTVSCNTMAGPGATGIGVSGGSNLIVCNLITGNHADGIFVNGDAVIANNTITGNGFGMNLWGKVKLINNIVAYNTGQGVWNYAGTVTGFSHNDVHANNPDYDGFTPPAGQGNLSEDPLFTNRAANDFHLLASSPCIDAGDDTAVSNGALDHDGSPRIQGARVDIGAYEYGSAGRFTLVDVSKCLSVAAGLGSCTPDDFARLNVETGGAQLDMLDVLRLTRKVAGLEPNP